MAAFTELLPMGAVRMRVERAVRAGYQTSTRYHRVAVASRDRRETTATGGVGMSEYQYYEFQAIDKPLTKQQMAELRAISTRAEITPTRFTNEYNFGSFKGDPTE